MQPYFFPYLPYWKLISKVNKYIIFDDVNFIKKGYINRNNILLNDSSYTLTVPLSKISQNKKINEIETSDDEKQKHKLLKTVETSYKKAPYFKEVYPFVEQFLLSKDKYVITPLIEQIKSICSYLQIETEILISSEIKKNERKKGEDKVIDICKILNATTYVNAIGGRELYSKEKFANNGIELKFLASDVFVYKQFNNSFVPNLSIIDVLMFNSKEVVIKELKNCELI